MNSRLILAVITSLLDEAIIVGVVLWLLPMVGVDIPVYGLVIIILVFAAYAVISFRIGSKALGHELVAGLSTMIGTEGKAVNNLAPVGLIDIRGELWKAKAENEYIDIGAKVIVIAQDGLSLTVRKIGSSSDKAK